MNNDLTSFVAKVLLVEILVMILALSGWFFLDGGGVIIALGYFWLFLSGIVNFVLLLLLVMYRPKLWLVFIMPLLLLPIIPYGVSVLWIGALLENLVKNLLDNPNHT